MSNEILNLSEEQIKEIQNKFGFSTKLVLSSGNIATKDWLDDSVQVKCINPGKVNPNSDIEIQKRVLKNNNK